MDPTYLAFFRFFGLRENPFNVNPDPSYLFLNQRTQNALVDLKGAIQARKGLMVLTGDVGTGKTTLVNYLMEWLQRQGTPTAFIFNPRLQVSELFDLMLASFAIPGAHGSALLRLNQWLLERYRERQECGSDHRRGTGPAGARPGRNPDAAEPGDPPREAAANSFVRPAGAGDGSEPVGASPDAAADQRALQDDGA